MKNVWKAHVGIILANVIFGLGVPITKYLLERWLSPMSYMSARCVGAAVLFWLIACFLPKERIARRDLFVILLGGVLGFVISQTLTAWALKFTTPVYYSLIATLCPIAVMLLAALFIGERINLRKLLGVVLAIAGAALMVVLRWQSAAGSNDVLGISLALLSLLAWAVYLIITRQVSQRYSAVSQMKWFFLISALMVLPVSWGELPQSALFAQWPAGEAWLGWGALLFIVVLATVLGYFFIPYAMRYLSATSVSIYTNLQPVVASVVAIYWGQDHWSWDKPLAAVLVLTGVYLVTVERNVNH